MAGELLERERVREIRVRCVPQEVPMESLTMKDCEGLGIYTITRGEATQTAIFEPEAGDKNIRKHVRGIEYNVYNRVNGETNHN